MRIERKTNKVDEGDVFYVEPKADRSPATGMKKRGLYRLTPFVIAVICIAVFCIAAITVVVIKYTSPQHLGVQFALKAADGKVALTERQLRDVVVGEGLTVYWLGPEDGALYTLISVNANQIYVRYLPGGQGLNDAGANFRVIGTYASKDAFTITQNEAKTANSVGFINSEGNAIYYNTNRPLSVYVGLKNSPNQIEIFNPTARQALFEALTPGTLKKIT